MKKVCVVTGGGSGIGFAAAKEAAKKGYYVMIVGRMWGSKGRVAYCRNESAYGRCGENHAGKRTWNRQYQRCIF